jgi:hypothetical protein
MENAVNREGREGSSMKSMPVAIGLHLCDYLIVEDRTRKVSLVGTFTGLPMAELPGVTPPFS